MPLPKKTDDQACDESGGLSGHESSGKKKPRADMTPEEKVLDNQETKMRKKAKTHNGEGPLDQLACWKGKGKKGGWSDMGYTKGGCSEFGYGKGDPYGKGDWLDPGDWLEPGYGQGGWHSVGSAASARSMGYGQSYAKGDWKGDWHDMGSDPDMMAMMLIGEMAYNQGAELGKAAAGKGKKKNSNAGKTIGGKSAEEKIPHVVEVPVKKVPVWWRCRRRKYPRL